MCHHVSVNGKFNYIFRITDLKHSSKGAYADTRANLVLFINQLALERLEAFQFAVNHL